MEKINNIINASHLSKEHKDSAKKSLLKLLEVHKHIQGLAESYPEEPNFKDAHNLVEECFVTVCSCISKESMTDPDSFYDKIQKCLKEPLKLPS